MPSQTLTRVLAAPLVATLASLLAATPLVAESWTDLNETRTIEADLVGVFGDQVVLKLTDGRRVSVKLDQLRAESRLKARDLNEQLVSRRTDRIAELRKQADTAAAPAPDPLPQPAPSPDYQPPADGLSAVETLQYLDTQMRAGHIVAFYDVLPVTYRDQIDQLVAQASLKLDPEAWDGVAGTLHQVGDLIVTRQNWIFSHPRLQAVGDETLQPLRGVTLSAAGLLRDAFDPEAFPLEDLQTLAFRDWLGKWDDATSPYLATLLRTADEQPITFEQIREQRDIVTLRATKGEATTEIQMKQIDDRWVTTDIADAWPDFFTSAQETLDETPDSSVALGPAAQLPAIASGFLDPLRQAGDANEFHAALDDLFAQAATGVEFAADMIPESLQPSRGRSSAYPGGEDMYAPGEEMGEDMYGPGEEMYGPGEEMLEEESDANEF